MSALRLIGWRPRAQGSLRGFATVAVEPPGLIIHDCPVHRAGDRCYALLPGKPQIDQSGRVLLDGRGKKKFAPVIEMPDGAVRRRFSDAVVAAVERQHPGVLA